MEQSSPGLPLRWRYGVFPDAEGTTVVALGRIDLPLGEGLRLEMARTDASDDLVHVQVYIGTSAGEWALWVSCPRADLPEHEAALRALTPPDRPVA